MRETWVWSWVGKIPRGRNGSPLWYSCLENPQGQRSLIGYSPWDHKELDTTEWLSTHLHYFKTYLSLACIFILIRTPVTFLSTFHWTWLLPPFPHLCTTTPPPPPSPYFYSWVTQEDLYIFLKTSNVGFLSDVLYQQSFQRGLAAPTLNWMAPLSLSGASLGGGGGPWATAAFLPSDRQSWEVVASWDLVHTHEGSHPKAFSGYLDKRDFCALNSHLPILTIFLLL